MSHPGQSRIAPAALFAAAVASAVTTFVIARFGLTGTILGAALAPVIVALVAEGVRHPAERVRTTTVLPGRRDGPQARRAEPRRREGGRFSLTRVSWTRVLATGLAGFLIVVVAFTLADLARGDSPVSDRGTTFFTPGQRGPADAPLEEPSPDPPSPREETPEEEQPAETGPPPPPAPEPAPSPPTIEPAPPPSP